MELKEIRNLSNEVYCLSKKTNNIHLDTFFYTHILGFKLLGTDFDQHEPTVWISLTGDDSIILQIQQNLDNSPVPGPSTFHFHDSNDSLDEVMKYIEENKVVGRKLNYQELSLYGHKVKLDEKSIPYFHLKALMLHNQDFFSSDIDREKYLGENTHEEASLILSRVNVYVKRRDPIKKMFEKKLNIKSVNTHRSGHQISTDFIVNKNHNLIFRIYEDLTGKYPIKDERNMMVLTFEPLYKHYYKSVYNKLTSFPLQFQIQESFDDITQEALVFQGPDRYLYEVTNPYPAMSDEEVEVELD